MADDLLSDYRNRRSQDADFWNQTLANIGNLIYSIPERKAQAEDLRARRELQQQELGLRSRRLGFEERQMAGQEQAQQKAAQMSQAVQAIVAKSMVPGPNGGKVLDRKTILANAAQQGVPLEALAPHLEALDKIDASVARGEKERLAHVADLLDAVVDNKATPDAIMAAIAYGQANGWLRDEDIAPIYEKLASDQDPMPMAKQMRDTLRGNKEQKPLVAIGPGGLFDPNTMTKVAEAPPKASDVNVGSFEDYVLRRFGQNPTAAQITQARKDYMQADDRPSVSVRLPSGLTPGQALTQTRQLRNDYERETKSAKTINQQLAQMRSSMQSVRQGKATAGSQGVLVTFQKILDPLSVVRESEYARSAAGLSLLGRIEGAWDRIKGGGAGVTVKDLEQFVSLAEDFAKNQNAFANQSKQQIDALAKEYGLKPELITKDYAEPTASQSLTVAQVTALAEKMKVTYAEAKKQVEAKGYVVK